MQTTTPEMTEAPPREVTGLPSLALGAATRALRITAVVVLLAGAWAGLAAAAATAFYGPLVDQAGRALSEPLGALGVILTIVACAAAARRPREWRFALAGVAFGLTLLARADLAPAVPLVAI